MKSLILAAALSLVFAGSATAATCKQDAAAKKLSGAAATSFLKKCETDAKTRCEADSAARKLAGAAAASHNKKCITDAVGN